MNTQKDFIEYVALGSRRVALEEELLSATQTKAKIRKEMDMIDETYSQADILKLALSIQFISRKIHTIKTQIQIIELKQTAFELEESLSN